MRPLLILALFLCTTQLAISQCSWDNEICISGCSDFSGGDGGNETYGCFDPNAATINNPFQIDYCFSSPDELYYPNPFVDPQYPSWSRQSIYMLCIPDDICQATISVSRVSIDINGNVTYDPIYSAEVNTEDNRPTFCTFCETENQHVLPIHRDILSTIGLYRMCINYKCCDGDGELGSDNIIGTGSTCFYYEFVNAASAVDVELAFTASQQIENINGDPDIDGIIPTDGNSPGPELGPASAGVRVSTVGNGIIDYSVEVFEVDCNDQSLAALIHSETIPYNGDQEVFYSFLNIPNWENIYDPEACYKVITTVNSICNTYTTEAYFTITDICTFCLIRPNYNTNNTLQASLNVQVQMNGDAIYIESDQNIRTIILLDEYGRILARKEIIDQRNSYLSVSQLNFRGRYFLVVTITKDGIVQKTMIPNM